MDDSDDDADDDLTDIVPDPAVERPCSSFRRADKLPVGPGLWPYRGTPVREREWELAESKLL